MEEKDTIATPPKKSGLAEIFGSLLIIMGVLFLLSLYSFQSQISNGQEPIAEYNLIGAFGHYWSELLFLIFGKSAFLLGPYLIMLGFLTILRGIFSDPLSRFTAIFTMMLGSSILGAMLYAQDNVPSQVVGGLFGSRLAAILQKAFGIYGTEILAAGILTGGMFLAIRMPMALFLQRSKQIVSALFHYYLQLFSAPPPAPPAPSSPPQPDTTAVAPAQSSETPIIPNIQFIQKERDGDRPWIEKRIEERIEKESEKMQTNVNGEHHKPECVTTNTEPKQAEAKTSDETKTEGLVSSETEVYVPKKPNFNIFRASDHTRNLQSTLAELSRRLKRRVANQEQEKPETEEATKQSDEKMKEEIAEKYFFTGHFNADNSRFHFRNDKSWLGAYGNSNNEYYRKTSTQKWNSISLSHIDEKKNMQPVDLLTLKKVEPAFDAATSNVSNPKTMVQSKPELHATEPAVVPGAQSNSRFYDESNEGQKPVQSELGVQSKPALHATEPAVVPGAQSNSRFYDESNERQEPVQSELGVQSKPELHTTESAVVPGAQSNSHFYESNEGQGPVQSELGVQSKPALHVTEPAVVPGAQSNSRLYDESNEGQEPVQAELGVQSKPELHATEPAVVPGAQSNSHFYESNEGQKPVQSELGVQSKPALHATEPAVVPGAQSNSRFYDESNEGQGPVQSKVGVQSKPALHATEPAVVPGAQSNSRFYDESNEGQGPVQSELGVQRKPALHATEPSVVPGAQSNSRFYDESNEGQGPVQSKVGVQSKPELHATEPAVVPGAQSNSRFYDESNEGQGPVQSELGVQSKPELHDGTEEDSFAEDNGQIIKEKDLNLRGDTDNLSQVLRNTDIPSEDNNDKKNISQAPTPKETNQSLPVAESPSSLPATSTTMEEDDLQGDEDLPCSTVAKKENYDDTDGFSRDDDQNPPEPELVSGIPPLTRSFAQYKLSTNVLHKPKIIPSDNILKEIKEVCEKLPVVMQQHGIQARVVATQRGPIITLYEIKLEPGIKVARVLGLEKEICMHLAVPIVRIIAPIPGKSTIGIEMPNKTREPVVLGQLFPMTQCGELSIVLGKDIAGQNQHTELTRLPHLLIAGATGAGKSVYLNAVISSLLYQASPEDVRFVMIDPKMVELKLYEGIPHLLMPVITDVFEASRALRWLIDEMESRYQILSHLRCRDIRSYNERMRKKEEQQAKEGNNGKMPYIVVLIDELSDLMMIAAKDVEDSIIRLTQKARAVGIHIIMATQRPSVDVITALIKANCPARVAFQVAQRTDSRTILDANGAENLIGRGDFLYKSPQTTVLKRIQAPFVSEEEVEAIVQQAKRYGEADYVDLQGGQRQKSQSTEEIDEGLFEQALNIVFESGKTSTSYLQRRMRIGYNRAANLIEMMEERGYLSPALGNKPREILKQSIET